MTGHYSVVRWMPDIVRGEFRNVGVILVVEGRSIARALPSDQLPINLQKAGILAALLEGMVQRAAGNGYDVAALQSLHEMCVRSLRVTPPHPTVIMGSLEEEIAGLWRDYLEPRPGDL